MVMFLTLFLHLSMCSELQSIYPSHHHQTCRSVFCPSCLCFLSIHILLSLYYVYLYYFLKSATTMKTDHLLSEFFVQSLLPFDLMQPFLKFYPLSGPLRKSFSGAGHLAAETMSFPLLLSQAYPTLNSLRRTSAFILALSSLTHHV